MPFIPDNQTEQISQNSNDQYDVKPTFFDQTDNSFNSEMNNQPSENSFVPDSNQNQQQSSNPLLQKLQDPNITDDQKMALIKAAQNEVEEKKSIFSKAADAINGIYDSYKNAPVVKQLTQGVGAVVGGAGYVIGAATGGTAKTVQNIVTGKPITQDVLKTANEIGKDTASFGYGIGKEGAAAAPLGGAGRAVNLAVAYGQGYQGGSDLISGYKEGDYEKAISGGLGLATSLVAAKGVSSSKGALYNPEVVAEIKKLPEQVRAKAAEKVYDSTVSAYKSIVNQTPKEIQAELKSNKNTPEFLAKQGIILEAENGKLNTVEAADTLRSRIEPLETQLNEYLSTSKKKVDFEVLRERTIKEIKNKKGLSALDKKDQINSVNEAIDAEIEANNGKSKIKIDKFNDVKRGFWNNAYNPQKTSVANQAIHDLGSNARQMIEDAIPEKNIREINSEIGDHASAIRFLDKINGRVIKGGTLTRLFTKGVGATIGSFFGPAGTLAGSEIAGKVSDIIRSPSLKTKIAQKALRTLEPKQVTTNRSL